MKLLLLILALALGACRLDAECYGTNECSSGLVCYRGNCVEPFAIGDAGDAGLPVYTWIEHVEPIVRAHCQRCHGATLANGAPFSLMSWADTQAAAPAGGLVHERMAFRVNASTMPPDEDLTPIQIAIIRGWSAAGAPEGDMNGGGDSGVRDFGTGDGGPRNPLTGVPPPTRLGGGFLQTEAPTWRAAERDLLFLDVPRQTIHRLTPPNTVTVFRMPTNEAAAIRFDPQGNLLATQFETRRVARYLTNGTEVSVADRWLGRRFNSPNDLDVRADGTIYFSDPGLGLNGRPREINFNGVYRITTTSSVIAEWRGPITSGPNGVELSEDERTLYVSDSIVGVVRAWDVQTDGALMNERMFAMNIPGADGMSHDDDGNIYVAGAQGITVIAPSGVVWGRLDTPEPAANTGFGGADRHTLYIGTNNSLYSAFVPITGPY